MPQAQLSLIRFELLLEKTKCRKDEPFRLLPHDQVNDHGQAHESEAAEQ
jgi:hypothetical protein